MLLAEATGCDNAIGQSLTQECSAPKAVRGCPRVLRDPFDCGQPRKPRLNVLPAWHARLLDGRLQHLVAKLSALAVLVREMALGRTGGLSRVDWLRGELR